MLYKVTYLCIEIFTVDTLYRAFHGTHGESGEGGDISKRLVKNFFCMLHAKPEMHPQTFLEILSTLNSYLFPYVLVLFTYEYNKYISSLDIVNSMQHRIDMQHAICQQILHQPFSKYLYTYIIYKQRYMVFGPGLCSITGNTRLGPNLLIDTSIHPGIPRFQFCTFHRPICLTNQQIIL